MTNPYEPPKTQEAPGPGKHDAFELVVKWQRRGFFGGFFIAIGGALLSGMVSPTGNPLASDIADIIGAAGAMLMGVSVLAFLPVIAWGWIKGYREGRRRG